MLPCCGTHLHRPDLLHERRREGARLERFVERSGVLQPEVLRGLQDVPQDLDRVTRTRDERLHDAACVITPPTRLQCEAERVDVSEPCAKLPRIGA